MNFFSRNYDKFVAVNENMSTYVFDYVIYVETRLSTNVSLLNNAALMAELGLNRRELLEETRKLLEISKRIEIPEVEKERKGFFR